MKHQPAFDFTGPSVFDPRAMAIAPSEHREARETSALAAIENATLGRKAKQCTAVLDLIRASGMVGMSDLELHRATGFPRQSICGRRHDLRSILEPAPTRHVDQKSGRSYTKWRVKVGVE